MSTSRLTPARAATVAASRAVELYRIYVDKAAIKTAGGITSVTFRTEFKTVKQVKPKASRDKSSEIFLLGRGLKNPVEYKSGSAGDAALDI